ncbi:MAG TPA: hypothetical protein VGC41_20255, partial [Kofleriaceae bacterium]
RMIDALAAIAVAIAAIELLVVGRAWTERGVFSRTALRLPIGFGSIGTAILLGLQLASAVSLPLTSHPAPAIIAFATTWLIAIRFRGSYNGGSDAMLLVVLLGISINRLGYERVGMGYIAAQLILSYAISGIAKLREPSWRDGTALPSLLANPQYNAPAWALRLAGRPVSYALLGFEVLFPLALTSRVACMSFLAIAAAFHLGNAIVLGLNRFLWTWLAAFPALWFWVERMR